MPASVSSQNKVPADRGAATDNGKKATKPAQTAMRNTWGTRPATTGTTVMVAAMVHRAIQARLPPMTRAHDRVLAIGDLQGCGDALARLLSAAGFDPARERAWFCGDLVNRGPESLATLRQVRALGNAAVCVLGNHDLHLLAVAAGARQAHRSDTLHEVLAAPDRNDLIDWLRHRPLAHAEAGALLVHAGVLPQWSAARTMELAAEVEQALQGTRWQAFLRDMYGNEPASWDDALRGIARLRVVVNALTRMRFVLPDGTMEFATKEGAGAAPAGHLPWFDVPNRRTSESTVVFGHWSTLGLLLRPNLIGLDTGCVWGGRLTGVWLHDRSVVQVDCPQHRRPGAA